MYRLTTRRRAAPSFGDESSPPIDNEVHPTSSDRHDGNIEPSGKKGQQHRHLGLFVCSSSSPARPMRPFYKTLLLLLLPLTLWSLALITWMDNQLPFDAAARLLAVVGPRFLGWKDERRARVAGRLRDMEHRQRQVRGYAPLYTPDVPRQFDENGVRLQSLQEGKRCTWRPDESSARARHLQRGTWDCVECTVVSTDDHNPNNNNQNDTSTSGSHLRCQTLEPRGDCPAYPRRFPWDDPPRSSSFLSPHAEQAPLSHTLTHFGLADSYEQADCPQLLGPPCFHLHRCHDDKTDNPTTTPISVFAHGPPDGAAAVLVQDAADALPHLVRRVNHAEEACLLVAHYTTFATSEQLLHALQDGANHLLWRAELFLDNHMDRPFVRTTNLEFAALASATLTDAHWRRGYDVPLHLVPHWKPLPGENKDDEALDAHRPRRLLLSFRGKVNPEFYMPHYHHRWLAAAYWNQEDANVYVEINCHNQGYPHHVDYGELLLNSTFLFCPGGGGVTSFRFAEALSAGGIPVVLANLIPPLHPEVDWSPCLVRVTEERIVDLPRRLALVSPEEIVSRRQACARLYRTVIAGKATKTEEEKEASTIPDQTAFRATMRIWHQRVRIAKMAQDEGKLWQSKLQEENPYV